MLITASLTVILYLAIRPPFADAQASISSAIFALLAATQFAVFSAIALWVPTRPHLLQALLFAITAAITATFGWQWLHGTFAGTTTWVDLTLALIPLGFAAITVLEPTHREASPARPHRWTRPVLTSLAVATACAALILVALYDGTRGMPSAESTALIALLGLGIAARIIANQVASTQSHRDVEAALADKEAALAEADHALEQVREANETLSESEEHLRLVFDAATDGVAELDQRGVVLRANQALCRMMGMDREAVEGQPWSALAAVGERRGGQLRLAAERGRDGRAADRRAAALPGVPRLEDPRDGPAHAHAGARRDRRPRGRPHDPLALPVPPGPRRGPHAAAAAGRTRRSRRSATGSRATCTTGRSRA